MEVNLTELIKGNYELKFISSFFPWKPIFKKWKNIKEAPEEFKDLKEDSLSLSRILNYLQYDIRNKIELLKMYNSEDSVVLAFLNRKPDKHFNYLTTLNEYYFIRIDPKIGFKE